MWSGSCRRRRRCRRCGSRRTRCSCSCSCGGGCSSAGRCAGLGEILGTGRDVRGYQLAWVDAERDASHVVGDDGGVDANPEGAESLYERRAVNEVAHTCQCLLCQNAAVKPLCLLVLFKGDIKFDKASVRK